MKVWVLGSGSSGNAVLVECGELLQLVQSRAARRCPYSNARTQFASDAGRLAAVEARDRRLDGTRKRRFPGQRELRIKDDARGASCNTGSGAVKADAALRPHRQSCHEDGIEEGCLWIVRILTAMRTNNHG